MIDDEDEPADACAPVVAEALRRSSPRAAEMVRQHIEDNDEVLSTILLGDLGDWFTHAVHLRRADEADARAAVDVVSELFRTGDEDMKTVIATGFLEALPRPGDADRAVIDLLPPPLLEELRRMENWVPSTR